MQAIEIKTNSHNGYIKLHVPVKEKEVRVIVIWDNDNERNYDIILLKKLVNQAAKADVFGTISNPAEWQRQIRNEWQ